MSMILTLHPDNPQPRLLKQAAETLRQGGLIVWPTDSGYALACLPGEKKALERLCRLRQLDPRHQFTLICRDLTELSLYARVDNPAFRLLRNNTPGPYTFVLTATKEVPRRLMNEKRKTVGLRVTDHRIASALLAELEGPLISSSLLLPGATEAEADPQVIAEQVGRQVDLILDGGYLPGRPTTVIDLTVSPPEILREGAGSPDPFR